MPGLKKAELIDGVVYMAWPGLSPQPKEFRRWKTEII